MIEIEIDFKNGAPPFRDWIADDQLAECKEEAKRHGVTLTVIGKVHWMRQLARAENPEI